MEGGGIARSARSTSSRYTFASSAIAAGADPNREDRFGERPLSLAVPTQNAPLCRLLVHAGANPNHRDKAQRMQQSQEPNGEASAAILPMRAGHRVLNAKWSLLFPLAYRGKRGLSAARSSL
ncbi:hypothetical protein [Chthonomonas calidirosea]|uniref:hypothetical protein n=1 Tax=Chthonomonas calidirosea TaxID=454171 RepID=UPI003CE49C0A